MRHKAKSPERKPNFLNGAFMAALDPRGHVKKAPPRREPGGGEAEDAKPSITEDYSRTAARRQARSDVAREVAKVHGLTFRQNANYLREKLDEAKKVRERAAMTQKETAP